MRCLCHAAATVAFFALATLVPAQNQGISLNVGVTGYVDVPTSPLLVPPTGLTVEAWMTFDDSTVPTGGLYYWPTIARQNVAPGQESWVLRVGSANTNNRNIEWKVRTPTGLQSVIYSFAPGEFMNWTHLAGTYDGATLKIFKNGAQVSTMTLPTTAAINNAGGVLRIGDGDQSNPGNETWNGQIDELRVWPFPRTAGEIAAAMNQELQMLPGKTLTFNLNGNYLDSSHNLVGTPTGTVTFVNSPALSVVAFAGLNVGSSTTNCPLTIDSQLGSVPTVGNTSFAVWCAQGPTATSSPLGIAIAGFRAAPASQPPVLGINLAFDLSSVALQTLLIPATTGLGTARMPLPIPNNMSLQGIGLVCQFGFADSNCGPQGFSASDGVAFAVQ